MPANPELKKRILNSQLYRSGAEFTSAQLAGHIKAKTKAIGACLGNMANEKQIVKLEKTIGGMPVYQRRIKGIANILWNTEELIRYFEELNIEADRTAVETGPQ